MGQACATGINDLNTYRIDRRQGGPGFFIYQESTMIVGVTDQRLVNEGLQPGSILTHVNGEEVKTVSDYQRLADPAIGPRFSIRVLSPEETNTWLIKRQSNNPRFVVNTDLIVCDVQDMAKREFLNRRVERVNGVELNGDFEKFRGMTMNCGKYFITLSSDPIGISAQTLCDAISTFNQDLNAKITSEVETRRDNLISWQQLLSSLMTGALPEQGATEAEQIVSVE